jgi:hypothetical protein
MQAFFLAPLTSHLLELTSPAIPGLAILGLVVCLFVYSRRWFSPRVGWPAALLTRLTPQKRLK